MGSGGMGGKKKKKEKRTKEEKKRGKKGRAAEEDTQLLLTSSGTNETAASRGKGKWRPKGNGNPHPSDDIDLERGDSAAVRMRHEQRKRDWKERASQRASRFFGVADARKDKAADEGFFILNPTNQSTSHRRAVWFHGRLCRETTERKFRAGQCHDGQFLIRQNSSGEYVLSMVCGSHIYHFAILTTPRSFSIGKKGPKFDTLGRLVEHFHNKKGGLPCSLGDALSAKQDGFKGLYSKVRKSFKKKSKTGSYEVTATSFATTSSHESRFASSGPLRSGPRKRPGFAELDDSDADDYDGRGGSGHRGGRFSSDDEDDVDERRALKHGKKGKNSSYGTDASGLRRHENRFRKGAGNRSNAANQGKGRKKYEVVGLETHYPWFMTLVCMTQLVLMAIIAVKSGINFNTISFKADSSTQDVQRGFSLIPEELTRVIPANVFIGPDAATLIEWGAKYNPCMRKDTAIFAAIAEENEKELDFGCCTENNGTVGACGMTAASECPPSATFLGVGVECPTTCADVRLRPCCVGHNGTCAVTTQDYCRFVSGIWNSDAFLCSEVACLPQRCGFTMRNPEKPAQWYRFFLSVFVHAGLIHALLVAILQHHLGGPIEAKSGFLRMAIMYALTAVGGNLCSGLFSPYAPGLGAGGGVMGLIAIRIIDLFHSWKIEESRWKRLALYLFEAAVLFGIGTLPWVDNYAHLGGFVVGVLAALVFLPYVSFGKADLWRKRIFRLLAFVALIVAVGLGLILFYYIQARDLCPSCDVFQCYDWVANLCEDWSFQV